MQVNPMDYNAHFEAFHSKMYKLPSEAEVLLDQNEVELFKQYGLPDRALPFFYFDLHLHFLREIRIPQSKLVIGTCAYPASEDYLFLHKDGTVLLREKGQPSNYVNGSLEQLIDSVYAYSRWLEEIEFRSAAIHNYTLTEEDIFDIYYQLRLIDKNAVQGRHVWNYLIQFDKHKRETLASSSM